VSVIGLSVCPGVTGVNKTIRTVFENGVFRPIESVDLPEKSEVEFELRLVAKIRMLGRKAISKKPLEHSQTNRLKVHRKGLCLAVTTGQHRDSRGKVFLHYYLSAD
jgi:predicted DNA-binding antitoxin AbrB/MazE fold protein